MFGMFKRKPPAVMDDLIHAIYGANPPRKSADLERSITIAHEDLLFGRAPLSQVRLRATELFQGPIPYSTHDLAVSTALAFFKAPEFESALSEYQIPARLRVVDWAKDGKVVSPLAQSFEAVLYRVYKSSLSEGPERPTTTTEEAQRAPRSKVQDVRSPTVKDLLIARAPPWNRVAPIVIDTILETITDKGLLEAFAMHSMNDGLVGRYETLGWDEPDPSVIRAQISHILCQTGNRAVPSLAKALAAQQTDAATKALILAGDTFEAAIALAKNQVAAYAGLATMYGLIGKRAESHNWARRGLIELEETRRGPLGQALREGRTTVFPTDILDQAERQLRTCLEH